MLTDREKRLLFWASFLSLAAAGFGFAFRVAQMGNYGTELKLTNFQVGQTFGASLWPIAITMILFSLIVDRTGYKIPMYIAFALQAVSAVGTAAANSYGTLYLAALSAGLGHGIIEAVINPACAAVYPKEKTKWLTILHAAWPAGLVGGTVLILLTSGLSWRVHALWILLPAVAYAVMYLPCRFPVDERVAAGVPFIEMLRQVGFLGASLASFMIVYELGNQITALNAKWKVPENWFQISIVAGLVVGGAFGFAVKAVGKPLFFLLCLLMIPLATAELATDQWISKLMAPVIGSFGWNPALGLVFSASIMLVLRIFAGNILKFFTPPSLLAVSGLLSAVGLFWLSSASGALIFVAFVCYALGQTYYWPCVLGFVSERYPQGGALTLNTVSALGLLSVGIIGGQLIGAAFDEYTHQGVRKEIPAMADAAEADKKIFGMGYKAIIPTKKDEFLQSLPAEQAAEATKKYADVDSQAGRSVLVYAARFPLVLVIAFACIWAWFKSKGGYKAFELTAASGAPPAGGGGH
jgi:MFS family permease